MRHVLNALILFALCGPVVAHETYSASGRFLVAARGTASEEIVQFNTNSHKFHKPECKSALRCTRNCIPISRGEALKRGGVPCKICGG